MIKAGTKVSWTHVSDRGRTLSMSLREGVVEGISTEREPYDLFHGRLINMDGRKLVIRLVGLHDKINFPYLVVARSQTDGVLDIPVYADFKQDCERYIDECTPYATIKKRRGRERIAVARLRVKGQKSQLTEFVEAVVEGVRG